MRKLLPMPGLIKNSRRKKSGSDRASRPGAPVMKAGYGPCSSCAGSADSAVNVPERLACRQQKPNVPASWWWRQKILFSATRTAISSGCLKLLLCAATKSAYWGPMAWAKPPCCVYCWVNCNRLPAALSWEANLKLPILISCGHS